MIKSIARNKKAKHDYFLEDYFEAGIALEGFEVKSIKSGAVSIKESYCQVKNGEIYIINMNVTPYVHVNNFNKVDPTRTRKLLLNKKEIRKISTKLVEQGYSLLPVEVKDKNGLVKIDIALGKGKKLYDKRESLKEKQDKRSIDRAIKNYR